MMRRLSGVLVPALLIAASAAGAQGVKQGWAHDAGIFDPQHNGAPLEYDDALQRMHVQETLARWAIANDEGGADAIAALFTADGHLEIYGSNGKRMIDADGRNAVVKSVASSLTMSAAQGQRRHMFTNFVIDTMTRSTATMLAYALVTVPGDPTKILSTVVYRTELRREKDGVWRFSHLTMGLDRPMTFAPPPK